MWKQLCCLVLQLMCVLVASQKTSLDSPFNLQILRTLRERVFDVFGKTGEEGSFPYQVAQARGMIQEEIPNDVPFPCDVRGGRSPQVPESVNRLRPGDIDVIASIGDSLAAGAGAIGTRAGHILVENRGITAAGGGRANWRKYLTLPNIIKEFNPNLIGYALGDSLVTHINVSQLNVAESGAPSRDMPFMAEYLVERIKNDPRIDVEKDWKLISFSIGCNDFCTFVCHEPDPWSILENHKDDLIKVLRTLRDNLPRTYVNIYVPPNLKFLWPVPEGREESSTCLFSLDFECSCQFGMTYRSQRPVYYKIMERWQTLDEEIGSYPEFHTNDFTVEVQPIYKGFEFPKLDGLPDLSYMSGDCFHLSQKANALVANTLWNNLLEPIGKKSQGINPPLLKKFLCPSTERPYLATQINSNEN